METFLIRMIVGYANLSVSAKTNRKGYDKAAPSKTLIFFSDFHIPSAEE